VKELFGEGEKEREALEEVINVGKQINVSASIVECKESKHRESN